MDNLSNKEVLHLSGLARLEFEESQINRLGENLSAVVSYIEQISEVETLQGKKNKQKGESDENNQDITSLGVTGLQNVVAEDLPRAEDDQCKIDTIQAVKDAPNSDNGYIAVRAVL